MPTTRSNAAVGGRKKAVEATEIPPTKKSRRGPKVLLKKAEPAEPPAEPEPVAVEEKENEPSAANKEVEVSEENRSTNGEATGDEGEAKEETENSSQESAESREDKEEEEEVATPAAVQEPTQEEPVVKTTVAQQVAEVVKAPPAKGRGRKARGRK